MTQEKRLPVCQIAVVQIQIFEGGELLHARDAYICQTYVGNVQLCQLL